MDVPSLDYIGYRTLDKTNSGKDERNREKDSDTRGRKGSTEVEEKCGWR